MSNIAIFKSGQTPQYLKSVNTPDYDQDPDVIVNPDVSSLDGVEMKYWKRVGDSVAEMTTSEKQVVDDAEEADRIARIDRLESIDAIVLAKALVKAGVVTKTLLVSKIKEVLNG